MPSFLYLLQLKSLLGLLKKEKYIGIKRVFLVEIQAKRDPPLSEARAHDTYGEMP